MKIANLLSFKYNLNPLSHFWLFMICLDLQIKNFNLLLVFYGDILAVALFGYLALNYHGNLSLSTLIFLLR
jgi:hypothetical protein